MENTEIVKKVRNANLILKIDKKIDEIDKKIDELKELNEKECLIKVRIPFFKKHQKEPYDSDYDEKWIRISLDTYVKDELKKMEDEKLKLIKKLKEIN